MKLYNKTKCPDDAILELTVWLEDHYKKEIVK